MDDDARDTLAALDWINRRLNGVEGGDQAAVVRRLLAMDANIVQGVAEVLKIGLVCHHDGVETPRGRPAETDSDSVYSFFVGAYVDGASKVKRSARIKQMMRRYNLSRTRVFEFWRAWRVLKKSEKAPE